MLSIFRHCLAAGLVATVGLLGFSDLVSAAENLAIEEVIDFPGQRATMVRAVRAMGLADGGFANDLAISDNILGVLKTVQRHRFVPYERWGVAYKNRPLPIGYGQTISQPYIVALMTELLKLVPGARILEIGTGSGYQTAVLAAMGARVFTMEIIPQLAVRASDQFQAQKIEGVSTEIGDGYFGWPSEAPFDRIIVTAAAGHVPPPLIRQLKPGGRMVIPVGDPYAVQYLTVIDKAEDGTLSARQLLPVRFVPLTGGPEDDSF